MRIIVLSYILSDIADIVVPLHKELAGYLRYSVIKKKKTKKQKIKKSLPELLVTRLERRISTLKNVVPLHINIWINDVEHQCH